MLRLIHRHAPRVAIAFETHDTVSVRSMRSIHRLERRKSRADGADRHLERNSDSARGVGNVVEPTAGASRGSTKLSSPKSCDPGSDHSRNREPSRISHRPGAGRWLDGHDGQNGHDVARMRGGSVENGRMEYSPRRFATRIDVGRFSASRHGRVASSIAGRESGRRRRATP
jgi:hypothetical protein